MVWSVPVSCKANGDRNQSGAWLDSDLIVKFYQNIPEKNAKFKKLPVCQKLIIRHQTIFCKSSMCLHCVCKVSDA